MSNRRASWRERRWKIFEHERDNNPTFKAALDDFSTNLSLQERIDTIDVFLRKYKLSALCSVAVLKYIDNPELEAKDYEKLIFPPILYWNAEKSEIGPGLNLPPREYLRIALRGSKLSQKLSDDELQEIIEALAGAGTTVSIQTYMKRTELVDYIDEYYDDIEEYMKVRNRAKKLLVDKKLLGNVQPTKHKKQAERDALIMKLTEKGESDLYIATMVNKAGFRRPTENNIRQVRFKYKHKK